jgi:hypothetical protein
MVEMPESFLAPKRRRIGDIGDVSNNDLGEVPSEEFEAMAIVFLNNTSENSTPLLMPSVIPTADVHAEVLMLEPLTLPALEAPMQFTLPGPPPQYVEQQAPVERAQASLSPLPFAMIPTSRRYAAAPQAPLQFRLPGLPPHNVQQQAPVQRAQARVSCEVVHNAVLH